MNPARRVLLLIAIMVMLSLVVEIVAIGTLYRTAMRGERERLVETVQSQARLIEAIARFDSQYTKDYPGGARDATLSQIVDAHDNYRGFGKTGEFTLSQLEGNMMVFLLRHRHGDRGNPMPIPMASTLAEPMRLALSGRRGTVIGLDYRGVRVLAAYEPLEELNLGIVAKIDLAEIRAPFKSAARLSAIIGLIVVLTGTALFLRVTEPLLKALSESVRDLQAALGQVRQLSGLLPICASCKRIRDDKGYWNRIESYIGSHSEAEFSHGVCPSCIEKLYPELAVSANGESSDEDTIDS